MGEISGGRLVAKALKAEKVKYVFPCQVVTLLRYMKD